MTIHDQTLYIRAIIEKAARAYSKDRGADAAVIAQMAQVEALLAIAEQLDAIRALLETKAKA